MKNLLLFIFCIALSPLAFSQPANDNCFSATNLGTLPAPGACGVGIKNGATVNSAGTIVGATPENPYGYLTGCSGSSATMSVPANDVWYTFTAPANGYGLVITITSTFATPNIGVYQGNCASLVGLGCTVGSAGSANITIPSGIVPGQTYYLQISGGVAESGTFNLGVNAFQDCSDCLNSSHITVNPLPVGGAYAPGTVVNFCYHIDQWTQIANNWLHGVQLAFGSGWNLASLTTTPPPTLLSTGANFGCGAGSCGSWSYHAAGTTSSASGVAYPAGF